MGLSEITSTAVTLPYVIPESPLIWNHGFHILLRLAGKAYVYHIEHHPGAPGGVGCAAVAYWHDYAISSNDDNR